MLPIHFAPLQGYTEDAYRRIHHELYGGIDMYYTPFVRYERSEVRSKDLRDIKAENNTDVPVTPQVIVADGKELEQLLKAILPQGYKSVDINMGCPFPLQTRHGKGAGLLIHPDGVKEISKVIKSHTDITFSIKMRLGLDNNNQWQQILPILNDTPLEHITVHPRIASQQYKGQVDMQSFEEFMQQCRRPLVYNGDISTIADIIQIETKYPDLAGIMIGRGLLARPSLAAEYKSGVEWSPEKQLTFIKKMHNQLRQHYAKVIPGESQQLQKLKTFWDYLEPQNDYPTLLERKLWKKIKKAGNMSNYLEAVDAIQ